MLYFTESCGGVGKCRAATPDRRSPLFGICRPFGTPLGTLHWNQCVFPADQSWIKGAIGAPLLFCFIICVHVLFMWTRRMHGSIPIYTKRFLDMIILKARKAYLLPPADASNTQILYVLIFICLGLFFPGIIQVSNHLYMRSMSHSISQTANNASNAIEICKSYAS